MPTRILRDYTDSPRFDGISADAERLFVRLLMKADDFGRFHANPKLIKAACFPLSEDLRANTVVAWLTELSGRQLVFCYKSGAGEYLALPKFRQRTRAEKSKFPPPDGEPPDWHPPDVGQVSVTCQTPARVFGDGCGVENTPLPPKGGVVEGKGSGQLPTTEQSKRIAGIFHRKLTTPWPEKEVRAYKKIGVVPEEDLAAVEAYYAANWPPGSNDNILRRDPLTFLNNFAGEVCRAHAWATEAHNGAPKQVTMSLR